jgi:PAS domain S-box-containing protein
MQNAAAAARFLTLFQHLKSAQLVEDQDRRVALVNQAFCDMFGIPATPDQLMGTDCAAAAEAVMPLFKDPAGFKRVTDHAVRTHESIDGEILELVDGRVLERDYTAVFSGNTFYGHVWTYRDITAARRTEQENARLRGFYEQVLDALPAQVAVFDDQCRFQYVNRASIGNAEVRAWVLGRTNEDYCRHRDVPVEIGEERSRAIRSVFASGTAEYFEETIHRHGERRVIERSLAPIKDEHGAVVLVIGFGRDLTTERRAQEALADSEERLRLALQGADLGTWDWDLQSGAISTNDRYLELLGYAPGEITPSVEVWQDALHPDDAPRVIEAFKANLRGETPFYESEHRVRHKDGHYRWIYGRGRLLSRDANGAPVRTCGTIIDVTERREAELEVQRARAEAEEATAARERFLANISHELRTPLNAIVGLSHHLARPGTAVDQQRAIEGIRFSADNLLGVINDLLDMTRMRSGHMELDALPFEIRALLSGLVNSLQGTAQTQGLSLDLVIDETLPMMLVGDPVRLNQVLSNLVGNAVKFTAVGGVSVRASSAVLPSGAPGISIAVSDTGIGIAPQDLNRVFDPFLQASSELTRSSGGTGLGLSIVRDLVRQMGGTITLESRVGAGSTFSVLLPLVESSAALVPSSAPVSMSLLTGLDVLIVEDNEMNSYVARVVLEHAGAHVTVVANGQEAIDSLRQVRFDVVLMDIQMPVMDGFEASWRIRNELGLSEAELPIIALTATALADEQRRANASGMTDYIMKPFKPETLCLRIAQILERTGRSTSEMRIGVHAPAMPDTGLLAGRRVLLVEDNEMNRRVATIFLEQSGAIVVPAASGVEALGLLAQERFDIALMDIQMPEMDGFETTRRIRDELGLPATLLPIVALTATSLSDSERRAKAAEMSDYILKPFHPDLLCQRVAAILASTARAAATK